MDVMDIKSKIKPYINRKTLKSLIGKAHFLVNAPLIIGVFLIICAGLGIVYLQHEREQDDLSAQLAITSAALQNPPQDIDALETELDQKTSELEELIQSFPSELVDTELIAAVLQTAIDTSDNITITEWEVGSPTRRNVGANAYLTFPFSIKAWGSLDELLNFIEQLESQTEVLTTLVFESAKFRSQGDESSVDLSFYIYAQ